MKRIYIATAFLLLTISLAIFEAYYVSKQTETFVFKIEEIDNSMKENNLKKAYSDLSILEKEWEDKLWTFEIMLNNDSTDAISENLAALSVYTKEGNNEKYFSSSEIIKKQLTSLKDSELLSFENIL